MHTTMPETAIIRRIARARGLNGRARIDLSAVIGLDVDLVLGYEYELPEGLSEEARAAAEFAAAVDEAARIDALVDMAAEGDMSVPASYGRLLVLVDELTRGGEEGIAGDRAA